VRLNLAEICPINPVVTLVLLVEDEIEVSCDRPGSLTSVPYYLKFLKEDGFVPVLLIEDRRRQ